MLHSLATVVSEGDRSLNSILEFAPGAMIWTFIAFFAALPVMWKFVYGPITTALEERDRKVEDSIAAADQARKEAEAQMQRAKAELEQAQAHARRMVEEATARAERQAAELALAAEARAKAELQKARDTIAAEKRQALQEIRQEAVRLTMAATGKLLQQKVDDEQNRRLVEGFLQSAAGAGASHR
ncbi:MAG: F0F1 ATP synthase subunit B [Planctomycetes bacterium]|nr:F0F1 ATP synthase subunit B [Planctomycetota bacterium]